MSRSGLVALAFVVAVGAVAGIAGATSSRTGAPTFSLTRLQAEEVAALVGFLHAYNRADLKAALSYFTTKRVSGQTAITATDCDYRRQKTQIYVFREGLVRWLKQRFADHDRLTLGRVYDENSAQPVAVVLVEYARRTSGTLKKLGYPKGIVPQIGQKLPFRFERGLPKFPFFGLASTGAQTPNPECALVAASR